MVQFTESQLLAIIKSDDTLGNISAADFATKMGWSIEKAISAPVEKGPARSTYNGQTSIIILYSKEAKKLIFTVSKGFVGRDEEWILADWKKTVEFSRSHFCEVVHAEDVKVYIGTPQACATFADKEILEDHTANALAHFITNGFDVLTKRAASLREKTNHICECIYQMRKEEDDQEAIDAFLGMYSVDIKLDGTHEYAPA